MKVDGVRTGDCSTEVSVSTWGIWLSAFWLWCIVTLIVLCLTIWLAASFVMWFVVTPIQALIEAARRMKR